MVFGPKLLCSQCGASDFSFRHPSGRPRCTVCGAFAHGPEVAKWRARRRLTKIGVGIAVALALAGLVLGLVLGL